MGLKNKFILLVIILLALPLIFGAGSGGGGGSSGGSSGGSVGGSSSGVITPIVFNQYRTSDTNEMRINDIYRIELSTGSKATILVTNVTNNTITIDSYDGLTIRDSSKFSDYSNKKLNIGEVLYFDIDSNGLIDFSLDVVSIETLRAEIKVSDLKDSKTIDEVKSAKNEKKETDTKVATNEEKFPCQDLVYLKDRVKCRISQEDEDEDEESELYFLPEECRALQGTERAKCITTYKNVQPCWKFPQDQNRVDCVRRAIGFENSIASQKAVCAQMLQEQKKECFDTLKNNAFTIIKFRFYNLEERAEEYLKQGIDSALIVDFVANLELKKQEFNDALTIADKKEIVQDVKRLWVDFMITVKKQLGENNV